jgi:chromosome segregation ATPase
MDEQDRLAEIKADLTPEELDWIEQHYKGIKEPVLWLVGSLERLQEAHAQLREYAGDLEAERGRLRVTIEGLEAQLAAMRSEYDIEHHGMGVPGSDFARYGGSYHDRDGDPII